MPNHSNKPSYQAKQTRLPFQPYWLPQGMVHRVSEDKTLQSWLLDKGSLTAKIRQICPNMQVHILSETWECPMPSESRQLNLADGKRAWIRCVVLACGETPLVYARTVIPDCHPGNQWYALKQLGNRPLGEVLFQLKQVERHPFQVGLWSSLHWPYLNQFTSPHPTSASFARKSLFVQTHHSLLLTEVFLQNPINWTAR